uniref:Uncharacterized protein n=1 Tax=Arundo donax TaxID=35708 RepID=A0A0A9B6L8_ARUDO
MSNLSFVKNNLKSFSNILTIQIAPDIRTISMNWKRKTSHGQKNKFGNEFLRKLIWPIHIVASGGNNRKTIRPSISHHKHFGSSFSS